MIILLCSPDAFKLPEDQKKQLVEAFIEIKNKEHPVGVLSNNPQPSWFNDFFDGSEVQFLQVIRRQDGTALPKFSKQLGLQPYDSLVLAR